MLKSHSQLSLGPIWPKAEGVSYEKRYSSRDTQSYSYLCIMWRHIRNSLNKQINSR